MNAQTKPEAATLVMIAAECVAKTPDIAEATKALIKRVEKDPKLYRHMMKSSEWGAARTLIYQARHSHNDSAFSAIAKTQGGVLGKGQQSKPGGNVVGAKVKNTMDTLFSILLPGVNIRAGDATRADFLSAAVECGAKRVGWEKSERLWKDCAEVMKRGADGARARDVMTAADLKRIRLP